MHIVAALRWCKSPRCSISTLIYDADRVELLSAPKIHYFPYGYLRFRRYSKQCLKQFFSEIKSFSKKYNSNVTLEYKIVFDAPDVPYIVPAKESQFVFKMFSKLYKKAAQSINLDVRPQLRSKLTGKMLIKFKKELRSLNLVSRRKDTGYEYHLWSVALHATPTTYLQKLKMIRKILVNRMWDEDRF